MACGTVALALLLLLVGPWEAPAEEGSTVTIEVQSEHLTLQAKDAPLADILTRLAKVAGFVISFKQPMEDRVSVNLTDVGLDEGLQRLLQHQNTMFLYGKDLVPVAVYVYGPSESPIAPVNSGGTAMGPVASEPAEEGETGIQEELIKTAQKIEALEEELSAASMVESRTMSLSMQNLLADPEPSVRMTAFHWLAERQDTVIDAHATALMDGDFVVQSVAMQSILDHGVDDRTIEGLRAAADVNDEVTVRQMLSALFPK